MPQGGNAVDAAVATAFALAVVLPSAGNIGGGGFMVASVKGERYALDFRETAPASASRDMYLDAKGETGDRSVTGHLAAGVPGSVAGLYAAHQKLGSKPWASLIEPAIRLAELMSTIAYPSINTFFFTSGGAESSESSFKTARFYWKALGKPEKTKVIARTRAYHGVTLAAMSTPLRARI